MQEEINFCARCNDRLPSGRLSPCWRCCSDPFPQNTVLRSVGFRIFSRPKQGQAMWVKCGQVFTHRMAMHLVGKKVTGNSSGSAKLTVINPDGTY